MASSNGSKSGSNTGSRSSKGDGGGGRSRGRQSNGGGITNRPRDEEEAAQQSLPEQGRRKAAGQRPGVGSQPQTRGSSSGGTSEGRR